MQTVSMITLGLSALTPVVLTAQFMALNRRLMEISAQIVKLQRRIDAAEISKLETGLTLLRLGRRQDEPGQSTNRRHHLTDAVPLCVAAGAYFGQLLGDALIQNKIDLAEVRLFSRHLQVAIIGEASCHIELQQDRDAFSNAGNQFGLLRRAAKCIFHETIGVDPAPFLLPGMREHGVTIDFMARLYQQARDAGAIDAGEQESASSWFETVRDQVFRIKAPRFRSRKFYEELMRRLRLATSAIEETNRIIGLSRMVEQSRSSGRATRDTIEQFRRETATIDQQTHPYVLWGMPLKEMPIGTGEAPASPTLATEPAAI